MIRNNGPNTPDEVHTGNKGPQICRAATILCCTKRFLPHLPRSRLQTGLHRSWDIEWSTHDELLDHNTETAQERHPQNHRLNIGRFQRESSPPRGRHDRQDFGIRVDLLLSLALRRGRDIVAVSHERCRAKLMLRQRTFRAILCFEKCDRSPPPRTYGGRGQRTSIAMKQQVHGEADFLAFE